MPQATDLVTDLPADFEVFGQAVATSMADLLGGPSGYILSKASATDMDFTWIANDQGDITGVTAGTGIAITSPTGPVPTVTNSMATAIDAKGDLVVGTGSDAFARLAVGNNGETLVADSAAATGLRYQANTDAGKNGLINGAFTVSQRGATITGINTDGTYTADRWYINRGGAIDYAQKTVAGGSTPPANFDAYAQYINQTAANAFITINQAIETVNSVRFANKLVTFSFYARAAANTAKSKSLTAGVYYSTSDNTKPTTIIGDTTFTLLYGTTAADWTFCTLTTTVPSTARTVSVRFTSAPVGGLAVGDGYEITGTMLEIGSVATAFQTATGNQASELGACQRYYWRSSNTSAYANHTNGTADTATTGNFILINPVPMRVGATSIDFSTLGLFDGVAAITTVTNATLSSTSNRTTAIVATVASGLTIYRPYILLNNNNTAGYVGASAEL